VKSSVIAARSGLQAKNRVLHACLRHRGPAEHGGCRRCHLARATGDPHFAAASRGWAVAARYCFGMNCGGGGNWQIRHHPGDRLGSHVNHGTRWGTCRAAADCLNKTMTDQGATFARALLPGREPPRRLKSRCTTGDVALYWTRPDLARARAGAVVHYTFWLRRVDGGSLKIGLPQA